MRRAAKRSVRRTLIRANGRSSWQRTACEPAPDPDSVEQRCHKRLRAAASAPLCTHPILPRRFSAKKLAAPVSTSGMKITAVLWILLPCTQAASHAALPTFSAKLSDRPELSLSEAVRTGRLPQLDPEAKSASEMIRRAPMTPKRLVSRMPVIVPSTDVGRNMPIVAPKADIDLKMIVKVPDVNSGK